MESRVAFDMMSAIRDTLDARLLIGALEFEEWLALVETLGWSDDDFLDEVSRRWFPRTLC